MMQRKVDEKMIRESIADVLTAVALALLLAWGLIEYFTN